MFSDFRVWHIVCFVHIHKTRTVLDIISELHGRVRRMGEESQSQIEFLNS